MSTPTFGSKPRPETKILLVGGPLLLDRVMEGVALDVAEVKKPARNKKTYQPIG
jgi:hypothetical protein